MNTWEKCALDYQFTDKKPKDVQVSQYNQTKQNDAADPLIYPGIYCPSGLDLMGVLFRIYARPNPQVNLGAIDCSVSLIVCDLALPDYPIVYASDSFLEMTGWRMDEIKGRNSRFLQAPDGKVAAHSTRKYVDKKTVRGMREAIKANKEHRTTITNFTKAGKPFVNILTLIPITWDGPEYRYSVGFQCDKATLGARAV
ncbi:clock-controlled repressor of light regulated processes [Cryphonectria parasitica EP155]|uniref:Clock-controlled repressor of light regulated processes n=1 Tax=Cryphonectria parasitica (strain ATCC 38755 / EP155) TaxID=660469 RepID=A0A9P5CL69_CRYP1|nr:clock-controlled repressor of light regulated processes [Cryphonectria parasitica EP155]KAF3761510.1 clock-controlled repressor of light regulated processes [Cryphonectria parasitica EP155]